MPVTLLMLRRMKRTLWMAGASVACAGAIAFETSRPVQANTAPPQASQSAAPVASKPVPAEPATPAKELATRYCVSCHNQKLKTAGLALDTADATNVFNSAETWEKVIVQLRSRSMPPPGRQRPDSAGYDATAAWLEAELDRAAAAHPDPGRPADLHRLNRTEYANAVRDLVGVEIDGTAMLPPDEQAHGFDTNADALTVVPALLDRYLSAAAKIARLAIGDPTIRPGFERYTAVENNSSERTWLWQTERLGEQFPLGSRGGIVARHFFPVDGEYVFRVKLDRTYTGMVRGLNVPNEIEIRVDGVRVGQFTLGGNPELSAASSAYEDAANPLFEADSGLEARVPVKAGLRQVTVTAVKSDGARPEGLGPNKIPIWGHDYDGDIRAPIVVSLLFIGGPYNGQVPQDSPSRKKIFVCHPNTNASQGGKPNGDETACATKILSTLARRAYRRAVTSDDVQTLVGFYTRGRALGSFDAGIRSALERLLVSPDFLFRIQTDPANVKPGRPYRLSDVELASRLSFFLWSSIPDDELLDLAVRGKLRDAKVFDLQVRRMLADPKAREALVSNFFSQWLQLRNVWLLTPDANRKFPWFDDNLRTALVREAELFLGSQLREDRSVVDLLTADYTFLNEQLARHYGISNVYGSHFRRVTLADRNRWGLLGKGSILAITSYPHRTSPTIRGKWLLENILAAPVPPPPPTVNTNLEETTKAVKHSTVRDMLEQHRANPGCASCHARMDPLGYSLENFDALGQWRTKDGSAAIDASGVLLDGTRVDGPAALRSALVEKKDQFVKAVAGKLLMYAVGRELNYHDAPAIRSILRAAAADDYTWSSTILAITRSTPFQSRRARS
jgi:mono/diheme cytochrome c family protein